MHQHKPRKRFGQNFLRDKSVIENIVTAIAPEPGQNLLEIGPGQGAITEPILNIAGKISVVELDRDLIDGLKKLESETTTLSIYNQDALEFNLQDLDARPARVFGNLPYNISTPLLFHLFNQIDLIEDMTFMLQKEVVDRICAEAGEPNYSRLSVMSRYYCEVEHLFDVPPEAFFPPPKVTSSVFRLSPCRQQDTSLDIQLFSKLVRQAFSQRRKMLRNNLQGLLEESDFEHLGLSSKSRAQNLSLADYLKISLYIQNEKS